MKDEILSLRKLGLSISEINKKTGYTLTQICEVIYEQNIKDMQEDVK